jgi:hypothetical protein
MAFLSQYTFRWHDLPVARGVLFWTAATPERERLDGL